MPLSLFKKPAPIVDAPPIGVARIALREHVAKMQSIETRRRALGEKSGTFAAAINAPIPVRVRLTTLKDSIASRLVAAAVNDTATPDVTAEREQVADLERELATLDEHADIATKVRAQLQTESAALLAQYQPLAASLPTLLVDALAEDAAPLHPKLMEAQSAYHAVLREVFVIAAAIDNLSLTHRLGVFTDAQRFEQRFAPLPRLAPFEPKFESPHEAGRAEATRVAQLRADNEALTHDAQVLIARLMRGE